MDIRPIHTDAEYEAALAEIERLFDAPPNTPEGDRLEVFATLVEAYEEQHYSIPAPEPIEAIKYHMESRGLCRRDLEPYLGSRARVAEVLNRKRPLSLEMIRRLQTGLGIAAEILIQPYPLATSAPNKGVRLGSRFAIQEITVLTDAACFTMLGLVQRACYVVAPSRYSASGSRRGIAYYDTSRDEPITEVTEFAEAVAALQADPAIAAICGPDNAQRLAIQFVYMRIVDDDAINEQFHQLSALSTGQVVECRRHALAKRLDPLGQSRNIDVLLGLGIALPQLRPHAMVGLCHLLAFAFAFLTLDHLRQVHIEQPSLVAFKLREDVPQRLSARLQGLGQPCAHLCPLQCMGNQAGLQQDAAEVLPDEFISGVSRSIAGRAALALGQPQRIGAATTAGRMVAGAHGAAAAREPTLATTDESSHEVRIGRIMSPSHVHGAIQAALGRFEGLLTHDGWHRHGHPLCRCSRLLTLARAHWLESGLTPVRWRWSGASTLGHPRRGGRPQDAANRGDIPALAAPGGRHMSVAETLGDLR